jgi:hypothetical protein
MNGEEDRIQETGDRRLELATGPDPVNEQAESDETRSSANARSTAGRMSSVSFQLAPGPAQINEQDARSTEQLTPRQLRDRAASAAVRVTLERAARPLLLAEFLHTPLAAELQLTKDDVVDALRQLVLDGEVRQFAPFQSYNSAGESRPWWSYRLWNLSKLDSTGGQHELSIVAEAALAPLGAG